MQELDVAALPTPGLEAEGREALYLMVAEDFQEPAADGVLGGDGQELPCGAVHEGDQTLRLNEDDTVGHSVEDGGEGVALTGEVVKDVTDGEGHLIEGLGNVAGLAGRWGLYSVGEVAGSETPGALDDRPEGAGAGPEEQGCEGKGEAGGYETREERRHN